MYMKSRLIIDLGVKYSQTTNKVCAQSLTPVFKFLFKTYWFLARLWVISELLTHPTCKTKNVLWHHSQSRYSRHFLTKFHMQTVDTNMVLFQKWILGILFWNLQVPGHEWVCIALAWKNTANMCRYGKAVLSW